MECMGVKCKRFNYETFRHIGCKCDWKCIRRNKENNKQYIKDYFKLKDKTNMKLKDCISSLAFNTEYSDDEFNKYMDNEVIYEYKRSDNIGWKEWIGKEKNVHVWWRLDNGYGIGMNENMSRGIKFIVNRIKQK